MEQKMTFDQYIRMRDRNADYAKALARTNLAIRSWEKAGRENHSLPLMWLLDNYILQAFYFDRIYWRLDTYAGHKRLVQKGNIYL